MKGAKRCKECDYYNNGEYSILCKYCVLDGTCPNCALLLEVEKNYPHDWACPKCNYKFFISRILDKL